MAGLNDGGTAGGGARLPLAALLVVLAAAAGLALWLTVASETRRPARAPAAVVDLRPGPAPPRAAMPDPPAETPAGTSAAGAASPAPTPPRAASGEAARPAAPSQSAGAGAAPGKPDGGDGPPARPGEPTAAAREASFAPHDPALVRRSRLGLLPVVGADGRKPWRVYARPFDRSDKRPRVAIVITGLGLKPSAVESAIDRLPGEVTLAFLPYAERLNFWIGRARRAGHEVLLNLPMEPQDFPAVDPGPRALLTTLSERENRERLLWTLGRATGYVGVADFMGSRFTLSRRDLSPVFRTLHGRGLMFLDSRSGASSAAIEAAADTGLPWAASSLVFDDQASRKSIDADLGVLETIARKRGRAIGMGSPYPVTLDRVAAWAVGLEKRGIALAPVSALARGERTE